MLHEYNIKGTPVVYTIAVSSCSQTGDLDFALSVYDDMKKKGVMPDEVIFVIIIFLIMYRPWTLLFLHLMIIGFPGNSM